MVAVKVGGLTKGSHPFLLGVGVMGVTLTVIGLITDVAYHLARPDGSLPVACCGVGFIGHIVTLAGMVLALSWVIGVAFVTRRVGLDERRS